MGIQISGASPTVSPKNSGGATPTISNECVTNVYRLPEHRRVQTETLLPKNIAHNRNRRTAARPVDFGSKHPSSCGRYSKCGKIISADQFDSIGFFFSA